MTPMERIEGELSDAQKRLAELERCNVGLVKECQAQQEQIAELKNALTRQAKAAQQGMDAAKAVASSELEQAKRLYAECSPEALESEREANAKLTELVAELECERDAYRTAEEHQIALRQQLEQEKDALAAHVERIKTEESRAYKGGLSMPGLLHDIIYESPAISLDRRDALKQVEALERLRLLLQETKFDKAPSVARVVMQVNDAINRVKQEVGPLRLVASDHSDPHPNCELECGTYGTYCKCNAEAHQ